MENLGGGYVNEKGEFVRGAPAPERGQDLKYSGGFEQFYNDPIASELLEKASLEYLQTQDKEYFDGLYTGELDSEGYLIRKDGENPVTRPSQNIGGGDAMKWVIDKVKEDLENTKK